MHHVYPTQSALPWMTLSILHISCTVGEARYLPSNFVNVREYNNFLYISSIKSALKAKLDRDSPLVISLGLDGWSQHHHGYLGINGHYLNKEWERVIFKLACTPFDISHTGEHIFEALHWQLYDWDIIPRAGLCLRDNAANMQAAFELDISYLDSVGCLNHSLQLGRIYQSHLTLHCVVGKAR